MLENKSPDFRTQAYFHLDDSSLANYIKFAWADVEPNETYMHNWHIDAICEHLEAVSSGQITKLLINMPPRHLKSTLISVMWPTWEWTRKPWKKFLCSSYAGNLAIRDNIKSRLLVQSDWYQSLFGNRFKLVTELQEKIANDKNGYRLASSVGGSATGEGGDVILCLNYDTIIETNLGNMQLGYIVDNNLDIKVWSYNHKNQKKELKNIKKFYKNGGARSLKITLSNGATVEATPNHPFYIVGKGYLDASELKVNDEVFTYDQALPDMQQRNKSFAITFCKKHERNILQPQVFWGMAKGREQFSIQDRFSKFGMRPLQAKIQGQSWKNAKKESSKILFDSMQRELSQNSWICENTRESQNSVCKLPYRNFDISERYWEEKILLKGLCQQSTQSLYQGFQERQICSWNDARKVSSGIQEYRRNNSTKRQPSMLFVQKDNIREQERTGCASHRLQQEQQPTEQLNYSLSEMSRSYAWEYKQSQKMGRVFVQSIENGEWLESTYNLEVEDNHNYFANGILTHNCDDPHKIEEIESDTVRQGVLDWWDQTMNTRLNNPKLSARVITMQRLHEEDLVGHLLASNQGYVHLCLPMEYEGQKYFTSINWTNPFTGSKEKYGDPRTKEGELLFPKRYGPKEVQSLKAELLDYGYASKYQQHPIPKGGAMFHRVWFKSEKAAPIEIKKSVRYWDKAGTAGGGAFTVGVRMVILPNNIVIVEDVVRAQVADLEREEMIKQTAQMDRLQRPNTEIWIEQEPGSGGKDAAAATIRNLAGYPVYTERPTGDKMTRASPLAAYAKAGNVYILEAEWNEAFLREFEFFPRGKYKDQVDASSGAFNKLFKGGFAYNVGG